MKRISRLILIGAITLLVLTTACNLSPQPDSIALTTSPKAGQVTRTPISIEISGATPTPAPSIPITGMDVVSLQCQFCVNDEAHAVLIMSNQAFFNVADPSSGVTCLNAQEVNGRRILLCRGAQNASFTLNVCVDEANCLEFPIKLQPCPLGPITGSGTPTVQATFVPLTPVILTPRNSLNPPTGRPQVTGTVTTAPSTPLPTNTGIVPPVPTTSTEPPPEPTSTTEPATVEPPTVGPPTVEPPTAEPPPEPSATSGGTGGGGGGNNNQLEICHVSQGNSNDRSTITVSRSSWENVHSRHGDSMGAC